MTREFVRRLSGQNLLAALMRLTLHEGATCGSMESSDPGRIERIVMLRDELQDRLRLLDVLGLHGQHMVAHLEMLVLEHPEFTEREFARRCTPELKKLADQAVRG
jgi:hypothetical protein